MFGGGHAANVGDARAEGNGGGLLREGSGLARVEAAGAVLRIAPELNSAEMAAEVLAAAAKDREALVRLAVVRRVMAAGDGAKARQEIAGLLRDDTEPAVREAARMILAP